jgi:hypothetical protein
MARRFNALAGHLGAMRHRGHYLARDDQSREPGFSSLKSMQGGGVGKLGAIAAMLLFLVAELVGCSWQPAARPSTIGAPVAGTGANN